MNFAESIKLAQHGETHLFFVGQAGFILKSANGQIMALDLYLSDCVERIENTIGFKRLVPNILSIDEVEFDYIIATHFHMDHFDVDSIPCMMNNTKTKLLAAKDCVDYIDEYGIDNNRVEFVEPGQDVEAGDFVFHFVNCDHGLGAPQAVGVIIEVDGKRIYIAGDTCLRLDRVDEYCKYGEIDVLIGPINGEYGNMNSEDLVEFSKAINPKVVIPCHFGVCAFHGGNPKRFVELMLEEKREFWLMTIGERRTL